MPNDPSPLGILFFENEYFSDVDDRECDDYFSEPNEEPEGYNIYFGTHDQPKADPPTPGAPTTAPNEALEVDTTRFYGSGLTKLYPGHI